MTGTTVTLQHVVTGEIIKVTASTDHPQSSYGRPVWVTEAGEALAQVGLEPPAGYRVVTEDQ